MGKWVSYLNRERKLDSFTGRRPTAPPAPKGLYIYGNVGSGIFLSLIMFNSKENIFQQKMVLISHLTASSNILFLSFRE